MTKNELENLSHKIFEKEDKLPLGDPLRRKLFMARVSVGQAIGMIYAQAKRTGNEMNIIKYHYKAKENETSDIT